MPKGCVVLIGGDCACGCYFSTNTAQPISEGVVPCACVVLMGEDTTWVMQITAGVGICRRGDDPGQALLQIKQIVGDHAGNGLLDAVATTFSCLAIIAVTVGADTIETVGTIPGYTAHDAPLVCGAGIASESN